jgi:hypothetical protein
MKTFRQDALGAGICQSEYPEGLDSTPDPENSTCSIEESARVKSFLSVDNSVITLANLVSI